MPKTYDPIATYTVSGTTTTSYTFTSVPTTYTDLVLVCNFGTDTSGSNIQMQVGNGTVDTGTNYSNTRISGDGTTAYSGRNSTFSYARLNVVSGSGNNTAIVTTNITHLMNYSNTTTYKTFLTRQNLATGSFPGTEALVNLWRSSVAINTIKFGIDSGNFIAGSTFTLYGIASA